jgi:hypothetical protein
MVRNNTQRNRLATSYATGAPYAALFTADPGTSGSANNEVSGGSYTRPALNWGTASNGSVTSSATSFNVPTNTTVTYFGVTASGTPATADVQDSAAVTSQSFASAGTYTVTAIYTQN